MLSKNVVKYIQSLSHKKTRNEEGVFVAEGPKLAEEILKNNLAIKNIYATQKWIAAHDKNDHIIEVTNDELQRISNFSTANEVLVIAAQQGFQPEIVFKNKMVLALDGVQDPGNFATILRTADWFGIDTIIVSKDTADRYNPKVVQASMGSFLHVNIYYEALENILQNAKVKIYGALLNGTSIYDLPKINEGIILIGNEGNGIREGVMNLITNPVTIPGKGHAESLNAAVAAGIILSQLMK
jgi:TrmH family RNA methyltransferase